MSEIINNKLTAGIGRVSLMTEATNPFPLVGEDVTLTAATKWAQKVNFKTFDGTNSEDITVDNTSQRTTTNIPITTHGEFKQEVRAWNYGSYPDENFSDSKKRFLYAMEPQNLPYYEVNVDKEIVRTDEEFKVILTGENGYDISKEAIIIIYVLKENGDISTSSDVITTRTTEYIQAINDERISTPILIPTRGIYDIEVNYTDIATNKTISKRINKLVTITPRLAARPTEGQEPVGIITGDQKTQIKMYETGVNDLYCTFEIPNITFYKEIRIADIPAGYDAYTLVLSKPYVADDNCYSKIWLAGNGNGGVSNASGTPQFSFEHPLVITIDQPTPIEFHGYYYNCVTLMGDVHHTIWDGRGYYNLSRGIKFTKNPITLEKPTTPMMLLNGTSDVEVFECEFTDCAFTAMMSKTDPNGSNPQYWKGNFEEHNLWWHHNHTHDTDCEGCYIGYFDSGSKKITYTGNTVTFKNLKGEDVTYVKDTTYIVTAHQLTNFRFYRNLYERTGYDGVQISNCFGEVCYNTLLDCSWKKESSQTSGLSIQGFGGKCYNNKVINCYGPSLQVGPIADIEIFNNVVYSDVNGGGSVQMLFNKGSEYQDPDGTEKNDAMQMVFHNNVIAANAITINGRNTVQMTQLHMYDNVYANNGALVGNMATATMEQWKAQAINNVVFNFKDLYTNSELYKIADYYSGDFRIAYNSSLASMGLGTSFVFDHNGYRNWFSGNFSPIGPFQGKYIDPSIVVVPLSLLSVDIDNTEGEIDTLDVTVRYEYTGNPSHYRIGESSDLSDAAWNIITASPVSYTFKDTSYGDKTLYMQLKNSKESTAILHDTVHYSYKDLILNSISINGGAINTYNETVSIEANYTENSEKATKYRVSEGDIQTALWNTLVNPFNYNLSSGLGAKTIYVQLQDAIGTSSNVVSEKINLIEIPSEKMVLSIQDTNSYTSDGINIGCNPKMLLKTTLGNDFCYCKRKEISWNNFTDATAGAVTGDNSFDYPDKYMYRNQPVLVYANRADEKNYLFTEVPPGKYRIRLFASTVASTFMEDVYYKCIVSPGTDFEKVITFNNPTNIVNNISEWMVTEVDILEDGEVTIIMGILARSSTSQRIVCLNIFEFTKAVPLTEYLIGIEEQTGTYVKMQATCQPIESTQTDFRWSIVEPTRNATINPNTGVVTISEDCIAEEIITIKAISPYHTDLVHTKQITIQYNP